MAKNGTAELAAGPIPHTVRDAHDFPGASYVLPADEQEAARLRLQHNMLKSAFEGKLLLPPFDKNTAYFVLDSGTGSAAWLLDIATRMSPSTILHGIDIESRLFPTTRPLNISFSINSISALPMEWTHRFDYVHQRLLIAGLNRTEWPKALQQIARVLKPGGWVQLSEVGACRAGPNTERHRSMVGALFKSRDLVHDISSEIPNFLQQSKFRNIQVQSRSIPIGAWAGQLGKDARDNFIGVYRGMKTSILHSGGLGFVKSEEEFDKLLDLVEKEWDETEDSAIDFHIFYAQTPITDVADM